MRFFLLFISVLPSLVFSQDLKVTVKSGSENLGFSNIYLNNEIYNVTNSEGIAYLHTDRINMGDTIKASNLGYIDGYVVFNNNIKTEQEIDIELSPLSNYEIDEVVVKGDVMKLFKKIVKPNQWLYNNARANNLYFSIQQQDKDELINNCNGEATIKGVNATSEHYFYKFKADGDTVGIRNDLAYFKKEVEYSIAMINQIKNPPKFWRSHKLSYLGIKADKRIFALAFETKNMTNQFLYYVNRESGILTNVEKNVAIKNEDGHLYNSYMNVSLVKEGQNLHIKDVYLTSKYKNKKYTLRMWNVEVENSTLKSKFCNDKLIPKFPKFFISNVVSNG